MLELLVWTLDGGHVTRSSLTAADVVRLRGAVAPGWHTLVRRQGETLGTLTPAETSYHDHFATVAAAGLLTGYFAAERLPAEMGSHLLALARIGSAEARIRAEIAQLEAGERKLLSMLADGRLKLELARKSLAVEEARRVAAASAAVMAWRHASEVAERELLARKAEEAKLAEKGHRKAAWEERKERARLALVRAQRKRLERSERGRLAREQARSDRERERREKDERERLALAEAERERQESLRAAYEAGLAGLIASVRARTPVRAELDIPLASAMAESLGSLPGDARDVFERRFGVGRPVQSRASVAASLGLRIDAVGRLETAARACMDAANGWPSALAGILDGLMARPMRDVMGQWWAHDMEDGAFLNLARFATGGRVGTVEVKGVDHLVAFDLTDWAVACNRARDAVRGARPHAGQAECLALAVEPLGSHAGTHGWLLAESLGWNPEDPNWRAGVERSSPWLPDRRHSMPLAIEETLVPDFDDIVEDVEAMVPDHMAMSIRRLSMEMPGSANRDD